MAQAPPILLFSIIRGGRRRGILSAGHWLRPWASKPMRGRPTDCLGAGSRMYGRGAKGRSRLAGWRIIAASCVARGFQQKTMEEIGRQNLKYYSPRSESDRGGLVLQIQFCYGETESRHHQPAPNWRQDKKYTSQHGQPDHGKAPTLVNAPTNSPSPGPRTPQQRGARSARPA